MALIFFFLSLTFHLGTVKKANETKKIPPSSMSSPTHLVDENSPKVLWYSATIVRGKFTTSSTQSYAIWHLSRALHQWRVDVIHDKKNKVLTLIICFYVLCENLRYVNFLLGRRRTIWSYHMVVTMLMMVIISHDNGGDIGNIL